MNALSQRWMALWLPRLSSDRLKRSGAAPAEPTPYALYAKSGNAFALTAVDAHAQAGGLHVGMALADARAMRPDLALFAADEAADGLLLDHIGAWCERFTPIVVLDAPYGLFLDISGCAHLFGGEHALLDEAVTRLRAQGFAARAAVAPTPGAAWALARFAAQGRAHNASLSPCGRGDRERDVSTPATEVRGVCVTLADVGADTPHPSRRYAPSHLLPQGEKDEDGALAKALAFLPIAALRLAPEAAALMQRLGLKTIGQIIAAPRAPFAARAGQHAMLRLDQALGRAREALTPRRPPPPVFAMRRLLEPIVALEAVLIVTEALCGDLCDRLDIAGVGARLLRLSLFGVDGKTRTLEAGLTRPERDPALMLRLLRERLGAAAETFDAAFGFEAARLDASEVAPILARVIDLAPASGRDAGAEASLVDTLCARLGAARVGKLSVRATHAPERASAWRPMSGASQGPAPPADGVMRRPLRLFTPPQLIEAVAAVPDGPPARFRWRRVAHEIARAEGPERIAPNWLAAPSARARDYYRVEDKEGRRFWLYREGLYGEGETPRWFLHGVFA